MKLLAICIPNYNRMEKLERLVREASRQIVGHSLTGQVQICISDDHSDEDPQDMIMAVRRDYPQVEILFERNGQNRGMDYNFLHSVRMAESEYCWIIGNDDMPTEGGIQTVSRILGEEEDLDILLTSFHVYDDCGSVKGAVYPLKERQRRIFDTADRRQYTEFLLSVAHNSGLFAFLSNVVFKKSRWDGHGERFQDRMDTIFIQMYMDIQTLEDGAVCLYSPDEIIRNYSDGETGCAPERICRVLLGLDGVVEHFFKGRERDYLKRTLVNPFISGAVWELPEESLYKKKVRAIVSPRNEIYRKYFVPKEKRRSFFGGKRILIYGTGDFGRKAHKELRESGAVILGTADSDSHKEGTDFEGHAVMSVESMAEQYRQQEASVVVANHLSLEEMVDTLLGHGIGRIYIIT